MDVDGWEGVMDGMDEREEVDDEDDENDDDGDDDDEEEEEEGEGVGERSLAGLRAERKSWESGVATKAGTGAGPGKVSGWTMRSRAWRWRGKNG